MKATEQYFPVVLFIMLYKVVLTFQSVGEILKCDQSTDIFLAVHVLLHGTICFQYLKKKKKFEVFFLILRVKG